MAWWYLPCFRAPPMSPRGEVIVRHPLPKKWWCLEAQAGRLPGMVCQFASLIKEGRCDGH